MTEDPNPHGGEAVGDALAADIAAHPRPGRTPGRHPRPRA